MLTIILCYLGLSILSFAFLSIAIHNSPDGEETKNGFHRNCKIIGKQ